MSLTVKLQHDMHDEACRYLMLTTWQLSLLRYPVRGHRGSTTGDAPLYLIAEDTPVPPLSYGEKQTKHASE